MTGNGILQVLQAFKFFKCAAGSTVFFEEVLNVEGLFDGGLEFCQCGLIIIRNLQHILNLFKCSLNKIEAKRL